MESVDDTTLAAISERVVEARCLERGLDVSRPSADVRGVDLIVSGLRVQVKSTRRPRLLNPNDRHLRYAFKSGNGDASPFLDRARLCDAFAFYAHDSGSLWILDSEYVRTRWKSTYVRIRVDQIEGRDDFSPFVR